MVEPQDTRANALPLDGVTEKRGRGRPRKPGALTNAQRQAAFRARRKASGVTVTVTKKVASDVDALAADRGAQWPLRGRGRVEHQHGVSSRLLVCNQSSSAPQKSASGTRAKSPKHYENRPKCDKINNGDSYSTPQIRHSEGQHATGD